MISPATPPALPPIRMLTEPLRPPVEYPEESSRCPEFAVTARPVETRTDPLSPLDVAADVYRETDPVPELALDPERMLMEPLRPVPVTAPLPMVTDPPLPTEDTEPPESKTEPP